MVGDRSVFKTARIAMIHFHETILILPMHHSFHNHSFRHDSFAASAQQGQNAKTTE
jgi:hypothetical protein